jgi:excisionase family DNA binding protein
MTQESPVVKKSADILTPKEAAEYLRVPIKSIYNRVQRKEISHIHLGRLLRFKKSELDRVLKVTSAVELEDWSPSTGKAS